MTHIIILSVNKRLDEWVGESWLDTRKVQFPRRDGAPTGGTTTPKKTHIGSGGGIMPSFFSMCVLLFIILNYFAIIMTNYHFVYYSFLKTP